MKKSLFLILFCMLMLFAGCEKKDPNARQRLANTRTAKDVDKQSTQKATEEEVGIGEVICDWDRDYKLTELECSKMHVTKPTGVCVFNEQVIICDKEGNKLSILDMNLNFVKELKIFAPDEEELFEPTGMTVFEDKLYLLDAGNNRILILDSEFVIQDSIELLFFAEHAGGVRYTDIAIDKEGIIYVCTDSVRESKYVYVIEDGEIQQSDRAFVGRLAEHDGEVYAVDSLELGTNGGDSMAASGRNYLYCMNKTEMKIVKELPLSFTPADFAFVNDKMVIMSFLFGSAYLFSCDDYEAKSRIADFGAGEVETDMYIAVLNETDYVITDQTNKKVYYLHY